MSWVMANKELFKDGPVISSPEMLLVYSHGIF